MTSLTEELKTLADFQEPFYPEENWEDCGSLIEKYFVSIRSVNGVRINRYFDTEHNRSFMGGLRHRFLKHRKGGRGLIEEDRGTSEEFHMKFAAVVVLGTSADINFGTRSGLEYFDDPKVAVVSAVVKHLKKMKIGEDEYEKGEWIYHDK